MTKLLRLPALAAALLCAAALPHRAAAQVAAVCHTVRATDGAFYPVPMAILAEHAEQDPAKVWSPGEMHDINTPQRTTIRHGVFHTCTGDVLVSQIVNRQCSTATECPARIVFRSGTTESVLLDYKQLCTMPQGMEVRGDLTEIRACGRAVALKSAAP